MKLLCRVAIGWLPLGIAFSILCLLTYVLVQQNYRESLNDPQIQIAEDAAAKLASGAKPTDVINDPDSVDMVSSLAPWLAIYNSDGVAIISSGELDGGIPRIPTGVFDAARKGTGKDTSQPEEDRVTWQSGASVRQAIVVMHYNSKAGDGFVVAGRNMREVEDRESRAGEMTLLAWAGGIVLTFLAYLFKRKLA